MARFLARVRRKLLGGDLASFDSSFGSGWAAVIARLDLTQETLGREAMARLQHGEPLPHLRDYSVRVFSQWGEDGILDFLLRRVAAPRTFVEFGVGDYTECNTRYLVRQGDWSGVIIEADVAACEHIRRLEESWRYDLRLVEAFITRDNINDLILDAGFQGEIGLLSIDIDGNDYWVWEALTAVRPAVVVVEYNGLFGGDRAVTIPYDPAFSRWTASPLGAYYGASLAAMVKLGASKGYDYVGSNQADSNAFFVRTDLRPPDVPELSTDEGFRPLRVMFSRRPEELKIQEQLPFVDV